MDTMHTGALRNYLETHRRRLGLTLKDVAHVMGRAMDGTAISRNEKGVSEPTLRTLLKYEILYSATRDELFEGLRAELLAEMRRNARGLVTSLERREHQTRAVAARITALKIFLGEGANEPSV